MSVTFRGLELRSTILASGELQLDLVEVDVGDPGPDELIVQVEATPINPSDLLLLLGPIDPRSIRSSTNGDGFGLRAEVTPGALDSVRRRMGRAFVPGNEGAGLVVAAGSDVRDLQGKRVGMRGGGMYTQYRKLSVRDCMVLPDHASSVDGASMFINPLTALCFIETMRTEGHGALIHFAGASNLGQMLNKICLKDGVGLVNIVRRQEQVGLLKKLGAAHVCNSTSPTFMDDLTESLVATGATVAFDAIGGGSIAGQILTAMEAAANRTAKEYSRYGSTVHKQVYIYGGLDRGPTQFSRTFGMAWGIGGWLLMPFPQRIGPPAARGLRRRGADELKTTFASRYSREISLPEALQRDVILGYCKRATGEKFLIVP